MSGFYDRYETRPPKSREAALFRDFKAIISVAKPRAAVLRRQVKGLDLAEIKGRNDLASIPILRKAELRQLQSEEPPFGGLIAARPAGLRHLLIGAADGHARDWWGSARALCAAGIGKGDIILNCFSYHLDSEGHIIESGALPLNCPVIPAGSAKIEKTLEAIRIFKPTAFCGRPDQLRRLVESADERSADISSLAHALVFGSPLSPYARREYEARGLRVHQAFATSDLGIIAYETSGPDGRLNEGMVVNEGLIFEIVEPSTQRPLPPGEIGEVVVTRLNVDYPILRLATGDLSRILPGPSRCGRTNLRIQGWLGRVDQCTQISNGTLGPHHVIALLESHGNVRNMRVILRRESNRDAILVKVEGPSGDLPLCHSIEARIRDITGLDSRIDIVPKGTLPEDGHFIRDERT